MTTEKFVTVSALTKYIKRKFDYDPHLRDIYIKGEISNLKQHSSGHMYFTLKDEKARISAVMFSSHNASLLFQPENGMKVLVRGEVSVFEQSGNYQVYVREMHPDGIGDLFIRFQQLKEQLGQEGLFSAEHKKSIPLYPAAIGVITSPTGAAVRDIITTLKRRYPMGQVIMYPALVQGPQAPNSVAKAIEQANREQRADVLIVGRGGGSIEELWAFNEEQVARSIFSSTIPIISAVGHETDTTIADFVADIRAATPTAAAELAVPHHLELKKAIAGYASKLTSYMVNELKQKEAALERLDKSYAFRFPERLYTQKVEQHDRLLERLQRESKRYVENNQVKIERLSQRLLYFNPSEQLQRYQENIHKYEKQLNRLFLAELRNKQQQFASVMSQLNMLNPLQIMERGYSIAFDEQENVIKSSQQVKVGDSISVVVRDGQLVCEVKERKESIMNE